jgi:hypothetical protein
VKTLEEGEVSRILSLGTRSRRVAFLAPGTSSLEKLLPVPVFLSISLSLPYFLSVFRFDVPKKLCDEKNLGYLRDETLLPRPYLH